MSSMMRSQRCPASHSSASATVPASPTTDARGEAHSVSSVRNRKTREFFIVDDEHLDRFDGIAHNGTTI